MRLNEINKILKDDKVILSADIISKNFENHQTVFFSYPEEYWDYIPETADPFFPGLLIPCMFAGEDLEIFPPLSEKLMENQLLVQDIFHTWHPNEARKVEVKTKILHKNQPGSIQRNATFFSLGVDSMYSLLKHLPQNGASADNELTSLVYMKGMELPLKTYSKNQDRPVIDAIKKVGRHYDLDVIIGETNLRDVFPLDWEEQYFGPGLASTALSLSNGFGKIFIPSSHSYRFFFHDPSSPLLDHLWSTEQTNIIHDGAEKERAQKISDLIAKDAFALTNLRVCIDNEGGIHNCGKCSKCIRTMITLEILGLLQGSETFPKKLPKYFSRQLNTYIPDSLEFTRENLKLAHKYGRKDIEKILQREIRIGNLDILRKGRPIDFVLKEVVFYYWMKLKKRLGNDF